MKKKLLGLAAVALVTVGLAACSSSSDSSSSDSSSKTEVLKIGASPTPHAEILEHVKPLLAKEGIDLEITKFEDYTLPNKALAEGDIDANYFQHTPFMKEAMKENDYDFVSAGAVHVEPMGIYSKSVKDIKDIKDGATVYTSNSKSDWGRILTIFQDAGLITLKDGVDATTATFDDIAENPKNLTFKHDLDTGVLVTTYSNETSNGEVVAINANFAYGAGLNPLKDALLIESDNSPYANIIAVRSEDKDDARVKKLIEVLHSKDVQDWITNKWGGSVKPVSE